MKPFQNLQDLKNDLEERFPEYTFFLSERLLMGRCITAMSSRISGADIFLHKNRLKIIPAIPDKRNRILLGSGVLFLRTFSKRFKEPAWRIFKYLEETYQDIECSVD
jgi:hypothetical protein